MKELEELENEAKKTKQAKLELLKEQEQEADEVKDDLGTIIIAPKPNSTKN